MSDDNRSEGEPHIPTPMPPPPLTLPSLVPPSKPPRGTSGGGAKPASTATATAAASVLPTLVQQQEQEEEEVAGGPAASGVGGGDARAAWAARDFARCGLRLLFPRASQRREAEEEGVVTFCRGEPLRLFLLVSRPHTSNSSKSRRHDDEASAFDRSWRRFAGEGGAPLFLRAEARVYVGERQQPPQQEQEQEQGEGGGEGERPPSLGRPVLVKGCNLTPLSLSSSDGSIASTNTTDGLLQPLLLSEAERALLADEAQSGAADVVYLVEAEVDLKPRYVDRRLTLALHLHLLPPTAPTTKAPTTTTGPPPLPSTTTTADDSAPLLRSLWGLALGGNGGGWGSGTGQHHHHRRVLYCGVRVVEPLLLTSTYACASLPSTLSSPSSLGGGGGGGGPCFVNVQVENRHPSQALLLEDVGFHLDHSLRGSSNLHHHRAPSSQPQPRLDRTLGYHPFTPQTLHADAFAGSSSSSKPAHPQHQAAAGSAFNPFAGKSGAPSPSKRPGHRYLHGPSSLHRIIAGAGAGGTPTATSSGKSASLLPSTPATTEPPQPQAAAAAAAAARPLSSSHHPPARKGSNINSNSSNDTSGGVCGGGLLTPLSACFRLHWVETAAFPLLVEPGSRHGLVFQVEPLLLPSSPSPPPPSPPPPAPTAPTAATNAAAAEQQQQQQQQQQAKQQQSQSQQFQPQPQLLRGPFWTPLTVAWRMQPAPSEEPATTTTTEGESPRLFTDKLVAWDAAAPLAQDFALAVVQADDGPPPHTLSNPTQATSTSTPSHRRLPHFTLNEARALRVSVANLTGSTADLLLRVDKGSSSSSSSIATRLLPAYSLSGRRGSLGASDSRGKQSQQQRPLSASFNMFQSQQQQQQQPIGTNTMGGGVEGEEGEGAGEGSFATEEETDEEEEEGEEGEIGVSSSSYAGRFEEWMGPGGAGVRWERCSGSNVAVLNTVIPIGPLEPMDEATVHLHLLPLRPGLCRLSNLLLEDRRTQRVYRLERPLELYVTASAAASSQEEQGEKGGQ